MDVHVAFIFHHFRNNNYMDVHVAFISITLEIIIIWMCACSFYFTLHLKKCTRST